MEVRMVSSFENHLQKIANSLQLFRYARNFNLLTAEMDGARFTYGGKTGWLKLHYATPCGSSKGLSFSEDENNF